MTSGSCHHSTNLHFIIRRHERIVIWKIDDQLDTSNGGWFTMTRLNGSLCSNWIRTHTKKKKKKNVRDLSIDLSIHELIKCQWRFRWMRLLFGWLFGINWSSSWLDWSSLLGEADRTCSIESDACSLSSEESLSVVCFSSSDFSGFSTGTCLTKENQHQSILEVFDQLSFNRTWAELVNLLTLSEAVSSAERIWHICASVSARRFCRRKISSVSSNGNKVIVQLILKVFLCAFTQITTTFFID